MKIEWIDRYSSYQRIKRDNGDQENKTLDYEIATAIAKLSVLGVNVKDLTI